MAKNIFNMVAVRRLGFINFQKFGHVTDIKFQICCCLPNFIKIALFFVEILRVNDFQDSGCPPP